MKLVFRERQSEKLRDQIQNLIMKILGNFKDKDILRKQEESLLGTVL